MGEAELHGATERLLGLQIEYEPTDGVPDIDIIAVPGLGAQYPWKRDVTTKGEQKYVNWLADDTMLPSQLPDARIMTFHYESRWHSAAPQQTLLDCGNELLQAIRRERARDSTQKDRPIIFIGHSLGGIVIEQAMVLAGKCQTAGDHFDLRALVAGFVFLGAPFRGSGSATAGRVFASAAKCLGIATEPRIIGALEFFSETLDSLLQSFSHWLFVYQVPFRCFYEKYRTSYGMFRLRGLFESMIVSRDSACIDNIHREGLYSDHLKIAKFCGPNDPDFVKVYREVGGLAYKARATICRRKQIANAAVMMNATPQDMINMMETAAAFARYENGIPAQILFGQPITFEDAHGFKWPIHIEAIFSWEALEYVMLEQFRIRGVKGSDMVKSGDYSVRNTRTNKDSIRQEAFQSVFRPGVRVNMSMLFKDFQSTDSRCPGCQEPCESGLGRTVTCKACSLTFSLRDIAFVAERGPVGTRGRRKSRDFFDESDDLVANPNPGTSTHHFFEPVLQDRPGDFARVLIHHPDLKAEEIPILERLHREQQEREEREERQWKEYKQRQKQKTEKADKETKAEEEQIETAMWNRLPEAGYFLKQANAMMDPKKKKKSPATLPNKVPIYAKIHKDHLDLHTLRYYNLPYETDRANEDYIIVLQEMSEEDTDLLFEHTKLSRAILGMQAEKYAQRLRERQGLE